MLNAGSSGNTYLHLRTELDTTQHNKMFFYHLTGYSLGSSEFIDAKASGYCNAAVPTNSLNSINAEGTQGIAVYKGSDGLVYLRLLFTSTYYLTLSVDAMRVGNGDLYEKGSPTPIFSTQVTL